MRTKLLSFLLFGMTVAALIVALKFVNWVPAAVQGGFLRRYDSVEDVRSKLKIKTVYTPSYYPQSFKWPPSQIAAQTRPYPAVVMEFTQKEKSDVCLVISQTALPHSALGDKIEILHVKETVRYSLKKRDAVLEVGVCKNDEPCSRITWDEGDYRISVVMKSTPADLIKIAESMIAYQKN
jgi:hypothetical protein